MLLNQNIDGGLNILYTLKMYLTSIAKKEREKLLMA